jgi:hypothetical protein
MSIEVMERLAVEIAKPAQTVRIANKRHRHFHGRGMRVLNSTRDVPIVFQ